jgi:hypothetical protein
LTESKANFWEGFGDLAVSPSLETLVGVSARLEPSGANARLTLQDPDLHILDVVLASERAWIVRATLESRSLIAAHPRTRSGAVLFRLYVALRLVSKELDPDVTAQMVARLVISANEWLHRPTLPKKRRNRHRSVRAASAGLPSLGKHS